MYIILLITSGGSIKNRVCRLQFDLTHEQVQFFTKFAEENLKGMNLKNVSDEFIENISAAMGSYMMTLSPLMKGIAEMSAEMMREQVDVQGESHLITCGQLQGHEIAAMLENKNRLSGFLNNAFSGINIMFGKEDETFVISNSSIITSTFEKDGQKAGGFGVIGPMRLDYKKIIPYLEYFSNKVTNLLKSEDEDEELLLIEREAEENE